MTTHCLNFPQPPQTVDESFMTPPSSPHLDNLPFSKQQINTANTCIDYYVSGTIRWIQLLAQMQSGKTDTFLFIASELLRRQLVELVIIFSGNTEIQLYEQLAKEALDTYSTSSFHEKYLVYLTHLFPQRDTRQISIIHRNIKQNIKIYWGSDLLKAVAPNKRTFFIWEESHYAQSMNQRPSKFLENMNISANGNEIKLTNNGYYVLSVSATPFSELCNTIGNNQTKKIVFLDPGQGYNSIERMMNENRIHWFHGVDQGLQQAFEYQRSLSYSTYSVIRVHLQNKKASITRLAKTYGIRVVEYDSTVDGREGENTWNAMDQAPSQSTVILLKGMCRMGFRMNKRWVSFVMETVKQSNTDTILQSLLGRVCGYSENSDKVLVYLHEAILKRGDLERYCELFRDHHTIPFYASNVKPRKGVVRRAASKYEPIIPIRFITEDKDVYNNWDDLFYSIVMTYSEDYDNEIAEMLRQALDIGYKRKFIHSKNKTYLVAAEKIIEAIHKQEAIGLGSSAGIDSNQNTDTKRVTMWIVRENIGIMKKGEVYISGFIPKQAATQVVLPQTTGKEVFHTKK